MSTRIHVQVIYAADHPHFGRDGYAAINDGTLELARRIVHPDTEVDLQLVPRTTWSTSHRFMEMLNNVEVVNGIIQAEKNGAHAAMIRCGNDPAVAAARETVGIPVVGMTEAAMHTACQLGSRFAVIGLDDKSLPIVDENIRRYGLRDRAIDYLPVRRPQTEDWGRICGEGGRWYSDADFVWDKVVPAFDEAARACIADGAEVIVTACGMYGALSLVGHSIVTGTDVPIVESVAIGIKQTEQMGSLNQTLGLRTSKHLTYRSNLSEQQRDALVNQFGL